MKDKITNYYENVDDAAIKQAVENFKNVLNEVNYENGEGLPLNTQAKYDSTFNNGTNYLKNTDILGMVQLCNSCLGVLSKITTYKTYYSGTYTSTYNDCSTKYNTYTNAPKKIELTDINGNIIYRDGHAELIDNPKIATYESEYNNALTALGKCEKYLNDLKNSIESVSL